MNPERVNLYTVLETIRQISIDFVNAKLPQRFVISEYPYTISFQNVGICAKLVGSLTLALSV